MHRAVGCSGRCLPSTHKDCLCRRLYLKHSVKCWDGFTSLAPCRSGALLFLSHIQRKTKTPPNHHQHTKNTADLMCALALTVKEPAPLTKSMEGRHKLTSAGALLLSNLPSWYNLDSLKPCTDPLLFMDPFPCCLMSHPTPCCSTVAAGTRTAHGITPVLHPHFPVPFPENTLQASTQAVQGPLSPCEDRKPPGLQPHGTRLAGPARRLCMH